MICFCQENQNIPLIYTSTANYHKEIIPPINRPKVITGETGYFFQTDEHPIEMVEAVCGPGALYYRCAMKMMGY